MTPEVLEILAQLAEERNKYKRGWDAVCDEFKIPQEDRLKDATPRFVIERLHTYLTGYIMRKSVVERETGAAFRDPTPPTLPNDITTQNSSNAKT